MSLGMSWCSGLSRPMKKQGELSLPQVFLYFFVLEILVFIGRLAQFPWIGIFLFFVFALYLKITSAKRQYRKFSFLSSVFIHILGAFYHSRIDCPDQAKGENR